MLEEKKFQDHITVYDNSNLAKFTRYKVLQYTIILLSVGSIENQYQTAISYSLQLQAGKKDAIFCCWAAYPSVSRGPR